MHENLGLSRFYMCLKHHENNLLCDAVASSLHGLSLTLRLSVWERERVKEMEEEQNGTGLQMQPPGNCDAQIRGPSSGT